MRTEHEGGDRPHEAPTPTAWRARACSPGRSGLAGLGLLHLLAALAGCPSSGPSGPDPAPSPVAPPAPAPVPAPPPPPPPPPAGPLLPAAVPAASTSSVPLPAGTVATDPLGAARTTTPRRADPLSVLVDDAGTTLVYGLQASDPAPPRGYWLYRVDPRQAQPTPVRVYDAVQRQANVALCPTAGLRYSLSQDGLELLVPENTSLTPGRCGTGTDVRGQLMGLRHAGGISITGPVQTWNGQRVAEVNWASTWNHDEIALLSFGGGSTQIRRITRPGASPALTTEWLPLTLPSTLALADDDNGLRMRGRLQLVPGGGLGVIGFWQPTASGPSWYSVGYAQLGTPPALSAPASALVPGTAALVDSVFANAGMTRTGLAAGEGVRLGRPLGIGFDAYRPTGQDLRGTVRAGLCGIYPPAMIHQLYTGGQTAPSASALQSVYDLFCGNFVLPRVEDTVLAVRGESSALIDIGGLLYLYDLQTHELRTGRVPARSWLHTVSSDGRWVVVRREGEGRLSFDLHDTRRWGLVPRS